MTVIHRPGKKHGIADALSRAPGEKPCPEMKVMIDPTQFPCGGCRYCTRAHTNWSKFTEDVEDVVPLGKTVEKTEAHAALSWLFSNDKEVYDQELQSAMHFTSLDISFVNPDISIISTCSMDEQQCNRVCTATCTSGFACIAYSPEELKDLQKNDSDLQLILPYLKTNEVQGEDVIFISSKAAKKYWVNKEMFFIDADGVLRNNPKNGGEPRLVVPKTLVDEVLGLSHDLPVMGHQGVSRTYLRVKEKFYWYNMNQSTKNFVRTCDICSKHKKSNRKAKCPMTKYQAGVPMERVHLDFLGPLPESTTGNSNILVMVDQFTKWVECIALPSQTADEVTARAAVNEFFARFGFPFNMFTDQGRNFESRLFKSICDILQIIRVAQRHIAHHPMDKLKGSIEH